MPLSYLNDFKNVNIVLKHLKNNHSLPRVEKNPGNAKVMVLFRDTGQRWGIGKF